jgi:chromosome segregation ATPase
MDARKEMAQLMRTSMEQPSQDTLFGEPAPEPQVEAPPLRPAAASDAAPPGAPAGSGATAPNPPPQIGYSGGGGGGWSGDGLDPKVHRLVREQVKVGDELDELLGDMGPKLTTVEEKLLGGRRKDRRKQSQGISPLEMLACLQTVVDEHSEMEEESLSKDDELLKLRKELTETIERQSQLVEEKHEFLKQQNQLLMGQQESQAALVELQNVRETHARDMAELNAQLSAALSASQGMSTVEEELARLRLEQADAVSTLTDQLQLKDVEIAECEALIAESERNRATNVAGLERAKRELAALREAAAKVAAAGGGEEAEAAQRAEARTVLESEVSGASAAAERAESEALAAAEEAAARKASNGLLKADLDQMITERDDLRAAVSEAEMKSAADAMAKVKVILQKVRMELTSMHVPP